VLAADPTSATRAVPAGPPTASRRLQPAPPPQVQPQALQPEDTRREAGRGRGLARLLLLVVILAAIAAVVYFAVFASGGGVELRDVNGGTTSETVQQMKELIDENTR
jgi:hypothetical protein